MLNEYSQISLGLTIFAKLCRIVNVETEHGVIEDIFSLQYGRIRCSVYSMAIPNWKYSNSSLIAGACFHINLVTSKTKTLWHFDVVLTVHLSIILVINQLNAQILVS